MRYEEAERELGEMGSAGHEVSSLCRMVPVIGSIPNRQMLSLEGSSVQGLAADMPVRNYYTAPQTYSASSWAGPYIGAQFGYEWGSVSN